MKAIEDLKRLVNERNLSLNEAKKLLFAPVNQVDSSSENWQALKDSYLESKSDRRSTTLKDINTRLNNLLVTLEKTPKPRTGRDAMRAYTKQWLKKAPQGGQGRKRSLQDVASFVRFAVMRCGKEERWLPMENEELRELVGVRQTTSESHLTAAVLPKDLANLLDQMKADGREDLDLDLATGLISLYGLRLGELAKLNVIDGDLFVGHIKQNTQTLSQEEKPPREVIGVDIAGREGEAAKVLQLYQSGLVKLPIAVANQIKMFSRKGRKPYLRQELQDESNHRNGRFQEEHPFMDRLSSWVRTRDKFTSIDALIGSRCRSEENLRKNDQKEAANCLKALGYHKKQVRVNGEREYLWSKSYDT